MSDELREYLRALERDGEYQVDAVLKQSDFETTERVHLEQPEGRSGPFIRKRFRLDCGLGTAYGRLCQARREGRCLEHLPQVLESYKTGQMLVVIMECIEGQTLADYVEAHAPGPELAREVFPSICDAVTEMHECLQPPLIHRDLKPSNIMVHDGVATVIDFGIARSFDSSAQRDTRQFGTPSFAPPEQFGFGQTDERTDIYALGILLYFCLTGEVPQKPLSGAVEEAELLPEQFRPLVLKAAAFDPAGRYPSARELKAAFLQAIPPIGPPLPYAGPLPETLQPAAGLARGDEVPRLQGPAVPEAFGTAGLPAVQQRPQAHREAASAVGSPQAPRLGGPLSRIPRWAGVIWNVLVAAIWLIFLCAATMYSFFPTENELEFSPVIRIVGSYGIFVVPLGILAFTVLDTRGLRRHDRAFGWLARRGPLAYAIAAAVAIAIALATMSVVGLLMTLGV